MVWGAFLSVKSLSLYVASFPLHGLDALGKIFTLHAKPPCLCTVELNAFLTVVRTRRPRPITQQHTVPPLRKRILQTATNALIRVHSRKQQRLNPLLFQELGTWRLNPPQ